MILIFPTINNKMIIMYISILFISILKVSQAIVISKTDKKYSGKKNIYMNNGLYINRHK